MKLTKQEIRPNTDYIRKVLKIEQLDKETEFEYGIKFLEKNYQHIYVEMSRNKMFWNWFKLQWEIRSGLALDLLSIEPEEHLSIEEISAVLEAYTDVHKIFIKTPSRPSKQLLKTIEKCKKQ